jgi:hypothetical protein
VTRLSWFSSAAVLRSLWRARGAMLAFSLLVQSACLIPQQIDQLGADAGVHPAPHFVLTSLSPDLLVPILTLDRQGSADTATPCVCHLVIAAPSVFEEDTSVTLQSRWFVDYDQSVPTSQVIRGGIPIVGNFSAQNPVRPVDAFSFNVDLLGISTSGVHVVEVLIADRDGYDDEAGIAAGFPFRTMKPDYEAALYRFVVQYNVTPPDPVPLHCAVQEYQVCGP